MSVLSLTQSSFSKMKPLVTFAALWLVLACASLPEFSLVEFRLFGAGSPGHTIPDLCTEKHHHTMV